MIRTPQDTSLTLAEAAEFLRCSPNTLRSLARQGKVGFKVGKNMGFWSLNSWNTQNYAPLSTKWHLLALSLASQGKD